MNVVFDPVKFLQSLDDHVWPRFLAVLLCASLAGVAVLVTKMALFIPAEHLSPGVFGYLIGLLITGTTSTLFSLGLTIGVFWAVMWLHRDRVPHQRILSRAIASLVPAHVLTVLIKSIVVILAPADMPVSRISGVTSLAVFFNSPPPYLQVVDPFLLWAAVLLAISHRTLTEGKRSWLSSGLSGLIPVLLVRLM